MSNRAFWNNKRRWDDFAVKEYAIDEAKKEALNERNSTLALEMKRDGWPQIVKYSKLSVEEIENL